jgi:hypothetical protein
MDFNTFPTSHFGASSARPHPQSYPSQ